MEDCCAGDGTGAAVVVGAGFCGAGAGAACVAVGAGRLAGGGGLETPISRCDMMGRITAQLISEADDGTRPELCFAVFHLSRMLDKLEHNYRVAWHGEPLRA